jgi:hypothetical protein
MRLSSDVNHRLHLMNQPIHKLRVANVTLNEGVTPVTLKIIQVSRIGTYPNLIHINQFTIRILCKHVPAKVASDKA